MKKVYFLLSTLLLSACSNFADDGDYTDAIQSVKERSNFLEIQGKAFSTSDIVVGNSQILNSAANMTIIFPKQNDAKVDSSYVAMSMTYFKSYNLYTEAHYGDKTEPLKAYKVTSETCNDNCTTTQYFTFPVDMATLEKAKIDGFSYKISTPSNSSVIDYKIPAGYIQAIFNEKNGHTASLPQGTEVVPFVLSKPQEMVEYWYSEATPEEKSSFSSWAFQNRKQVSGELNGKGKPSQMLDYWYKKASPEQRDILSWLLKVE